MSEDQETPMEWLRSHLDSLDHPDQADDRRCVLQAIAGLMELDELRATPPRPTYDEAVERLIAAGYMDPEDLEAIAAVMRGPGGES